MNEHREILSKYLRILFYTQIAYMGITCINAVTHWDGVTAWVNKGITVIGIWCLFQLPKVNPRYRTAAITRARELLIIVGREETVAAMVENAKRNRRYTGLKLRLQGKVQ